VWRVQPGIGPDTSRRERSWSGVMFSPQSTNLVGYRARILAACGVRELLAPPELKMISARKPTIATPRTKMPRRPDDAGVRM
jgi:hypothetical protein